MDELDPVEKIEVYRWPVALAVALTLGATLYLLQPILSPFVMGGLIAYLGDPLVDRLEDRGVGRTLGVAIVFLLFSAIVAIALVFALPMLLHQLDALIGKIPRIYNWVITEASPWLQQRLDLPLGNLPRIDWSGQLADNWQSVGKFTAQSLKKLTGSGANMLLGLANLALVPVVAFYLMRDWDRLMEKTLALIPVAWQKKTLELAAEADEVVGAFLRGQFLVMCALGAIYSTGLWLVGLQLAMLLGVVAGLASIVPYLGFIVGIVASLFAGWVQFQDWTVLLWVGLVFGVGQMVESMLLTPVLVGDRIGLHPVAVIFALMAGAQIAGFVGVVLALPAAAVVMVFLRHAMHHYRSSDLYGGD